MSGINQLLVSIELEGQSFDVGKLTLNNKQIYFRYENSFLQSGHNISPFKLAFDSSIQTPDTPIFDGLFGVFNDSLPDGWGRLLLDRSLMDKDILLTQINALDRLAYIGKHGRGALTYRPAIDGNIDTDREIELDTIAKASLEILEGTSSDIIDKLFQLGGSSGGARPKIFVGYNPSNDHIISGQGDIPNDYEHWIIKFPSSNDLPDIAQIEYAYYLMALDAGIEMTKCQLFKSKAGKHYFGTKRFDRVGNKKIHTHSAAGLLHDNFRLSALDYGHLMDAAFRLENNVQAYEKVLRLAAFNIFSHNRDDHSKNFSFLMNQQGNWRVAPAYDLTFSNSSHGHHSTTIAGEGKNPGRKQLFSLANTFGIQDITSLLDQVQSVTKNWKHYAKKANVNTSSTKVINQTLKSL